MSGARAGRLAAALLLLFVALSLAGCLPLEELSLDGRDRQPTPATPIRRRPPSPTPTATPTGTPTRTPTPSPTPTLPGGRQRVRVIRIWDGNTIEIEGGLSVRYIGVQTPGAGVFQRPIEPFGREAAALNQRLVANQTVELEHDQTDVNDEGFLLRYVFTTDGRMVNVELLQAGLASLAPLGPNVKYREELESAQRAAMAANRGIWSVPRPTPVGTPPVGTPAPPVPTATPTPGR